MTASLPGKKPPWLKRKIPSGGVYQQVRNLLKRSALHTVCEEALCPNLGECFSRGTATFMILGDRCTRNCRFCAIRQGPEGPPDPEEPARVAGAVRDLGLRYAVITSVTRDDLPDGGAALFAETVRAIRDLVPGVRVELLIPDLQGDPQALETILEARPDVLNHNIETVPRLYPEVRPEARYLRSLDLLGHVRRLVPPMATKSGLMLGLGEGSDEVRKTLEDLIDRGVRILTLGQYLSPSRLHHPVVRYVPPEEFQTLRDAALGMGFEQVASGPFVRSSYHAREMFEALAGASTTSTPGRQRK